MSSSYPELPFELVLEILARVPVKDLIRFRCVCTSWRWLFQDERFIGQHMAHAQTRVLLFRGFKDPLCHFFYQSGKPETILQEVDHLTTGDKSLLHRSIFIGHCHGLFCLYHKPDRHKYTATFYIWNPSLRELRSIPSRFIVDDWANMGFGYDYSTQDYKLVLVPDMMRRSSSKAQVLSLKSGVSRLIDFPSLNFPVTQIRAAGTLLNEHIYWLVFHTTPFDLAETILSFDFVSETFNYYPGLPSTCTRGQPVPVALEVLRGGLCTVGIERGDLGEELAIWSAQHEEKKKQVIKSWSKTFRLSWGIVGSWISPRGRRPHVDTAQLLSAAIYAGSLLFMVRFYGREAKLVEYNLEKNSLRIVKTSLPLDTCGHIETYTETLVPIPVSLSRPSLLSFERHKARRIK